MSAHPIIGIRDSGVGGLTVARCIRQTLPEATLLYFADTAHVPYGDRTPREVRHFALSISNFLLTQGAQILVFACNTSSAYALDLARLDARRLEFEPDYHDAPTWRREGSRPVNVVPLRGPGVEPVTKGSWWDDPQLEALEREYSERGTAAGVRIPGEYRGFIFKTVLALRAQGREITPKAISDSVARWLSKEDAARIETAIDEASR